VPDEVPAAAEALPGALDLGRPQADGHDAEPLELKVRLRLAHEELRSAELGLVLVEVDVEPLLDLPQDLLGLLLLRDRGVEVRAQQAEALVEPGELGPVRETGPPPPDVLQQAQVPARE
jgi:hypothetical protein